MQADLVELMARAMAEARTGSPEQWIHFKAGTVAALKAGREATNTMCEAGSVGPMERADPIPAITTSQADAAWSAMIDAAIAEADEGR